MKPTKPHMQWWTCPACGKRTYPTRTIAKRIIRRMKRTTEGATHLLLNPYPCGEGWHVGHTEYR